MESFYIGNELQPIDVSVDPSGEFLHLFWSMFLILKCYTLTRIFVKSYRFLNWIKVANKCVLIESLNLNNFWNFLFSRGDFSNYFFKTYLCKSIFNGTFLASPKQKVSRWRFEGKLGLPICVAALFLKKLAMVHNKIQLRVKREFQAN